MMSPNHVSAVPHSACLAVLVAALAAVTLPATAEAESTTEVELTEHGLAGVGPDGETRWRFPHAFRIRDRQTDGEQMWPRPDFPPVRLGDSVYYVMNADLLEIDPADGTVVDRTRFPTQIFGLERADERDALEVTLNFVPYDKRTAERPDDEDMLVEVTYRPGEPAPGRGPADLMSTLTPVKEVVETLNYGAAGEQIRENGLSDLEPETYRRVLDQLRQRAARNPTNSFFGFYRAAILERLDRPERAREVLREAASITETHWFDDLSFAIYLESGGLTIDTRVDSEVVDRVFQRGLDKMRSAGVRPAHMTSAMYMSLLSQRLRLDKPFEQGDAELVDRRATMMAEAFPRAQYATFVWPDLADWFAEQGHPELADKWNDRADTAEESLWHEIWSRTGHWMDLSLLAFVALAFAFVASMLVLGARAARRTAPDSTDPAGRLPGRLGWRDLAGVLLTVGLLAVVLQVDRYYTAQHMLAAQAPVESFDSDAYGTPRAIDYLESLAPGEARDTWLEYANAELDALRAGTRAEREPPPIETLADAFAQTAWQNPNLAGYDFEETTQFGAIPNAVPGAKQWLDPGDAFWLLLPVILAGLVAGGLAYLLVRYVPAIGSGLRWVVPGAARSAAPLGPVVCAAFVAPIVASIFHLDYLILELAAPSFAEYFGLGSLDVSYARSRTWMYVALPLSLLVHAATLWWDYRSEV